VAPRQYPSQYQVLFKAPCKIDLSNGRATCLTLEWFTGYDEPFPNDPPDRAFRVAKPDDERPDQRIHKIMQIQSKSLLIHQLCW
jgi:hypothetical protein